MLHVLFLSSYNRKETSTNPGMVGTRNTGVGRAEVRRCDSAGPQKVGTNCNFNNIENMDVYLVAKVRRGIHSDYKLCSF